MLHTQALNTRQLGFYNFDFLKDVSIRNTCTQRLIMIKNVSEKYTRFEYDFKEKCKSAWRWTLSSSLFCLQETVQTETTTASSEKATFKLLTDICW